MSTNRTTSVCCILVLSFVMCLSTVRADCYGGLPDGLLDTGEQCDDNNGKDGDGCSSLCTIEPGWNCFQTGDLPSICYQMNLLQVSLITGGADHMCTSTDSGRIYCWGSNDNAQAGAENNQPFIRVFMPTRGAQPILLGSLGDDYMLRYPVVSLFAAKGGDHTCVILQLNSSQNEVYCWGDNTYFQLGVPLWVNRTHIGDTAADMRTLKPVVYNTALGQAIGGCAGAGHTCLLTQRGGLICFGLNNYGQVGLETNTTAIDNDGHLPFVPLPQRAVAVECGVDFTCALLEDHTVRCWGSAAYGQLGIVGLNTSSDSRGTQPNDISNATAVPLTGTPFAIAAGYHSMCALVNESIEGTVVHRAKCWGSNLYGQTGIPFELIGRAFFGERASDFVIVNNVAVDFGVWTPELNITLQPDMAACGENHCCFRLWADQSYYGVKCTGRNNAGQRGISPSLNGTHIPDSLGDALPAANLPNPVDAMSANSDYTMFRVQQDTGRYALVWFGSTTYEQHTPPTADTQPLLCPTAFHEQHIGQLAVWASSASSKDNNYICAILNGKVTCYGRAMLNLFVTADQPPMLTLTDNGYGAGGDNGRLRAPLQIATGPNHFCVVFSDGQLGCYGNSFSGALGADSITAITAIDPDDTNRPQFVDLGDDTAVQVAVGCDHTCAVTASQRLKCWGDNTDGQLGLVGISAVGGHDGDMASLPYVELNDTAGNYTVQSVCTGHAYTCVLLNDTTSTAKVKCWGDNTWGQAGQESNAPNFTDPSAITPITLPANPVEISCGVDTPCVRTENGFVYCWGRNAENQSGNSDNMGKVAIGLSNGDIQMLRPAALPCNATKVAVGASSVVALCSNRNAYGWGQEAPNSTVSRILAPAYYTGEHEWLDIAGGGGAFLLRTASSVYYLSDYPITMSSLAASNLQLQVGSVYKAAVNVPLTLCQSGYYSMLCDCATRGSFNDALIDNEALPCNIGEYQDRVGATMCYPCPAGTFQQGQGGIACTPCPQGWFQNGTGSDRCLQCDLGSVAAGEASTLCEPCPISTYANAPGLTVCSQCPVGQTTNTSGSYKCVDCPLCPAGSYWSLQVVDPYTQCPTCTPCSENTFTATPNNFKCTECPDGSYSAEGATFCSQCPVCAPGEYAVSTQGSSRCNTCVKCPKGTYSTVPNSPQCQQCDSTTSYTLVDTGADRCCPICPAGYVAVSSPLGGCPICSPCPPNSYSSAINSLNCTACPPQTYTTGEGASECTNCTHCEPGLYTINTGSACWVCQPCPASTYSDQWDASTCLTCPAGFAVLANQTGCYECGDCPAGTFVVPTSTGCPSCQPCPINSFSNTTNALQCTLCNAEEYTETTGASRCCTQCGPGNKLVQNATNGEECPLCVKCDVNTISTTVNAKDCRDCGKGKYSLDGVTCTTCPTGVVCTASDPLELKDGYWRSSTNGDIVECRKREGCVGGSRTTKCAEGYSGVLYVCKNTTTKGQHN